MKTKGRIATFFQTRGFGFINTSIEGKLVSYFFHISACLNEPQVDCDVLFTPAVGKKGPVAIDVEVLGKIVSADRRIKKGDEITPTKAVS
jgi:cold shock CspA family protein